MTKTTALYRLYETFKCKGVPYELLERAFDDCMRQKDMTEAIAYCGLKHGMGKVLGVDVSYTPEEFADMYNISVAELEDMIKVCRQKLNKATKKERHKLVKQEPYKMLIKSNLI